MLISSLKQICVACPSTWEGKLFDGSDLYVKYRYGHIKIEVNDKITYQKQIGDDLDGWLNQRQLLEILEKEGFVVNENTQLEDELPFDV